MKRINKTLVIMGLATPLLLTGCGPSHTHSYNYTDPKWTWNDSLSEAFVEFECECGDKETHTATIDVDVRPQVCEGKVTDTYTAKVDVDGQEFSDVKTIEKDELGHDYTSLIVENVKTTYKALETFDLTGATVKKVCSRNQEHTQIVNLEDVNINYLNQKTELHYGDDKVTLKVGDLEKVINVSVSKVQVGLPTPSNTAFVYNATEQTYDAIYNSELVNVTNNKRTDAGEQLVTYSLKDTSDHEWEDETIEDKQLTFKILKAAGSINGLNANYQTTCHVAPSITNLTSLSGNPVDVKYFATADTAFANPIQSNELVEGNYVIRASSAGNSNYDDTMATATLTVTHDFVNEVKDDAYLCNQADCGNDATYYKSCNCGEKGDQTFTDVGSATGNHTLGDVSYQWSNDLSTCTAKVECSVCKTVISETVNVVKQETKTPTMTEKGEMIYTADFNDSHFEDQVQKVELDIIEGIVKDLSVCSTKVSTTTLEKDVEDAGFEKAYLVSNTSNNKVNMNLSAETFDKYQYLTFAFKGVTKGDNKYYVEISDVTGKGKGSSSGELTIVKLAREIEEEQVVYNLYYKKASDKDWVKSEDKDSNNVTQFKANELNKFVITLGGKKSSDSSVDYLFTELRGKLRTEYVEPVFEKIADTPLQIVETEFTGTWHKKYPFDKLNLLPYKTVKFSIENIDSATAYYSFIKTNDAFIGEKNLDSGNVIDVILTKGDYGMFNLTVINPYRAEVVDFGDFEIDDDASLINLTIQSAKTRIGNVYAVADESYQEGSLLKEVSINNSGDHHTATLDGYSLDVKEVAKGTTLSLTVESDEGYEVTVKVNGVEISNVNNVYSILIDKNTVIEISDRIALRTVSLTDNGSNHTFAITGHDTVPFTVAKGTIITLTVTCESGYKEVVKVNNTQINGKDGVYEIEVIDDIEIDISEVIDRSFKILTDYKLNGGNEDASKLEAFQKVDPEIQHAYKSTFKGGYDLYPSDLNISKYSKLYFYVIGPNASAFVQLYSPQLAITDVNYKGYIGKILKDNQPCKFVFEQVSTGVWFMQYETASAVNSMIAYNNPENASEVKLQDLFFFDDYSSGLWVSDVFASEVKNEYTCIDLNALTPKPIPNYKGTAAVQVDEDILTVFSKDEIPAMSGNRTSGSITMSGYQEMFAYYQMRGNCSNLRFFATNDTVYNSKSNTIASLNVKADDLVKAKFTHDNGDIWTLELSVNGTVQKTQNITITDLSQFVIYNSGCGMRVSGVYAK